MTDPQQVPSSADSEARHDAGAARPAGDPERGLRGVMSAVLLLEAITLLLGLTVLVNGGRSAPAWQLLAVTAVAVAHLLAPAVIKRGWAIPAIFVLQAFAVGCWVIHGAIGTIGVIFLLVWIGVMYLRREFRLRLAAGTIAGAAPSHTNSDTNEENHQ